MEDMKRVLLVAVGALVAAVVVLFFLVLKKNPVAAATAGGAAATDSVAAGVVYVNTDSLLLKYEYAQRLSEELMGKEESSRANFNEQARVFQNDMVEFNRKVQNNSFLSLERAQSEERRLRQKESELQELNTTLSNSLMDEQNRVSKQLRDTIANFLIEYCKDKPYSVVLSNTMGDNILYSAEGLDITAAVVEQLNARYAVSQKK